MMISRRLNYFSTQSIQLAPITLSFTAAPITKQFKHTFYSSHRVDPAQFEDDWVKFFDKCEDSFEVQRGLNNCFAYDICPQASILEAAMHACRKHNTFPTAARIFWALRGKVENDGQYQAYMKYLRPTMDKYGIVPSFDLGRKEIY